MTTNQDEVRGWREEFERSFSSKHGRNFHALANDGKRSSDCDVCAEDRRLNPKGYYLTFLNEQKCYWNRDMMKDVADWWLSKFDTLLANKREEIENMKRMESDYDDEDKRNRRDVRPYNEAIDDIIKILS